MCARRQRTRREFLYRHFQIATVDFPRKKNVQLSTTNNMRTENIVSSVLNVKNIQGYFNRKLHLLITANQEELMYNTLQPTFKKNLFDYKTLYSFIHRVGHLQPVITYNRRVRVRAFVCTGIEITLMLGQYIVTQDPFAHTVRRR